MKLSAVGSIKKLEIKIKFSLCLRVFVITINKELELLYKTFFRSFIAILVKFGHNSSGKLFFSRALKSFLDEISAAWHCQICIKHRFATLVTGWVW
jgi:hypothetical protein